MSDNSAGGYGGGIYNGHAPLGGSFLFSTIVTGNTASGNGGGIANDGEVAIDDSAVTGNTAGGNGGGIWNSLAIGVVILADTVVIPIHRTTAASTASRRFGPHVSNCHHVRVT